MKFQYWFETTQIAFHLVLWGFVSSEVLEDKATLRRILRRPALKGSSEMQSFLNRHAAISKQEEKVLLSGLLLFLRQT